MLETVRISAMQVSMLFVLIAVGVVLRRTHVFEGKGITCVTDILFYIISPCIIIDRLVGTVSDNGEAAFKILGWSALATCVAFVILIGLTALIFKGCTSSSIKAVRYSCIFANLGFMGIPLVEGILGKAATAYVGVAVAIFTMLNFIVGIALFTEKRKSFTAIFLNPGTIAIAIALVLIFLPFDPMKNEAASIVMQPISWLASAQTPLSMMLCGAILGGVKLKGWYKDKYLWLTVVLRLVVFSALTTAALLALPMILPIPTDIVTAIAITFACPAAVAGAMFSEKFGGNTELLTKSIALTTFLSIVTIPIVCAVCRAVYPVM